MYEEIDVVTRIEYECKYANEDRMVTPSEGKLISSPNDLSPITKAQLRL